MNLVVYTQRVEVVESYGERRDCADQSWSRLLLECGFLPLPLPNDPDAAMRIVKELSPAGIVLTGGNDLAAYGGNAPERDETERLLLEYALGQQTPVLGVCRGMQMIHDYFGGRLERVSGHVAVRHEVEFEGMRRSVNSYHNLGVTRVVEPFRVDAAAADGVIEAMSHKCAPIRAIMWHPEREEPFSEADKAMICELMRGAQ